MGGRSTRTFVRAYNRDAMARVRAQLGIYSEAELQKVAKRAQASANRKVQPIAKADIRERYAVKPSQLNSKFRTVEGRSRKGDPYVGIWASSRQISLIDFGGKWRKRSAGATASIRKGQLKTYGSAFIATIQGRRAIRVRAFANGTGKRHGRFPLRMLRGPSPFEMLLGENMDNGPKVAEKILTFHSSEIKRQMDLLRSKR